MESFRMKGLKRNAFGATEFFHCLLIKILSLPCAVVDKERADGSNLSLFMKSLGHPEEGHGVDAARYRDSMRTNQFLRDRNSLKEAPDVLKKKGAVGNGAELLHNSPSLNMPVEIKDNNVPCPVMTKLA